MNSSVQRGKNVLGLLLKNKESIFASAFQKHHWNAIAAQLIAVGVVGVALFGAVMSTYNPSWTGLWNHVWKMIVLVWGPIAICTPSLFVFSAIRGSAIQLDELVYLLLGAIATSSVVMLALAPITWFFTWTTNEMEFVRLMNVVAVAVSLGFGLFFLSKGFSYVHKQRQSKEKGEEDVDGMRASFVLLIWFVLLLVVTAQMAVKLGPWFSGF